MKKKQRPNWFFRTLNLLFLIFISLYIALQSGYYESKVAKKTAMTEESIKQFEQDVKDGKSIDQNEELENKEENVFEEKKDYSNNTTDAAIFIGGKIENFMSSGISDLFDLLKSLVT